MNRKTIPFLLSVFASCVVFADDTLSYQVNRVETVAMVDENENYGLSPQEISKYQYLMSKTLAGKWYKDLNPVEVLGLMATNDVERQKYAQQFARLTYWKVSQTLAFQHAYDSAWRNLYPNSEVVGYSESVYTKTGNIEPIEGDRFTLFTAINDTKGEELVKKIISLIYQKELGADIYVLNTHSSADLRAWAHKLNIPVEAVNQGKITLNFDGGRHRSFVAGSKIMKNPIVALQRQGEYQVLEVSSL